MLARASIASHAAQRARADAVLAWVAPRRLLKNPAAIFDRPQPLLYSIEQGLLPAISPKALKLHYEGHYKQHVEKLHKLLERDSSLAPIKFQEPEKIVMATAGNADYGAVFNHAGAVWSHEFFFRCMKPSGSEMSPELRKRITQYFGSVDDFKAKFTQNACVVFGSGWTWLIEDNGHLRIVSFSNANSPLVLLQKRVRPLLCIDMWEHSYYLDHGMDRRKYVDAWWKVVNWRQVEANMRAPTIAEEAQETRDLDYEASEGGTKGITFF
eukprot:tig00000459_g1102.t1